MNITVLDLKNASTGEFLVNHPTECSGCNPRETIATHKRRSNNDRTHVAVNVLNKQKTDREPLNDVVKMKHQQVLMV